MARPPGHGPEYGVKRQEIIDQAAELFAKKGFAATSVAELSVVVGLAKGALYYYIGSKENLLVEIQDRVLGPLLVVAHKIAQLDEDAVFRLRLLSEALLTIILRRLHHVWVYEHDYRQLSGSNRSRLISQRREFESIVETLLRAAIQAGAFRSIDTRLAMLQFLNLHNHTYQWAHPDGAWDASYLSREYCSTFISGLRTRNYDVEALETRVVTFRAQHIEWTSEALLFTDHRVNS